MKLWIAAAVVVVALGWIAVVYVISTPVQRPQVNAVAPTPAIESRVTALEVEVRRLARDRAKECGRMR
jgi:hypothetical protein